MPDASAAESPAIPRHKTALSRQELSRPVRMALADGLLPSGCTVTDYGCGQGGDARRLAALGFDCAAWDPTHAPKGERRPSDVVNVGYVVNVIEDAAERAMAVAEAWKLTRRVMVVSARMVGDAPDLGAATSCADGVLTRLGTFQKFFEQLELRAWIDETLGESCVTAGPGVFYVFRDVGERSSFVASRFRRASTPTRIVTKANAYADHRALLDQLGAFLASRGRLPSPEELPCHEAIVEALGSVARAFRVLTSATGAEVWDGVREGRAQDLLVYLALSRFDRRPAYGELPRHIQLDVKAFFRTYAAARERADDALFALGDPSRLDEACRSSGFGKLMPDALYVHVDAVHRLPTALRLYEGCARTYLGRVEGATIVKLRRSEPKVSYLGYPNFDADPHPALTTSVNVDLRTFRVRSRSYSASLNPPILHRKEEFVPPDHHLRAKFARLTRAEVASGLFDDPSSIGTRGGWASRLAALGLSLRGHRLLRR